MMWTLLATAMRTGEMQRLNMDDIQEKPDGYYLFVRGKCRDDSVHEQVIIAFPEAREVMRQYLEAENRKTGPLFRTERKLNGDHQRMSERTVHKIIHNLLRRAGIDDKRITPHSFRHTAITRAFENGADIRAVMAMARHHNMRDTMAYDHENLRGQKAAEKLLTYRKVLSPEKIYDAVVGDGMVQTSTQSLVGFLHFIEARNLNLKLTVTFEGKECLLEMAKE